jgi:hypothetical protein
VTYSQNELLYLLYKHLESAGLSKTAETLRFFFFFVFSTYSFSLVLIFFLRNEANLALADEAAQNHEEKEISQEEKSQKERVTLDDIVKRFLKDQHRYVINPFLTKF